MKTKTFTLICLLVFSVIINTTFAQDKATMLPGTVVSVKVVNEINSDDNAEAKIVVASDIKDANGNLLIAVNTPVKVYTDKKRSNDWSTDKGGIITITFKSTIAADGTYISLDGNYTAKGEDAKRKLGGAIKIGNKAIGKGPTPAIIPADTIIEKIYTKDKYEIKIPKTINNTPENKTATPENPNTFNSSNISQYNNKIYEKITGKGCSKSADDYYVTLTLKPDKTYKTTCELQDYCWDDSGTYEIKEGKIHLKPTKKIASDMSLGKATIEMQPNQSGIFQVTSLEKLNLFDSKCNYFFIAVKK